jgi:LysM repeat protein
MQAFRIILTIIFAVCATSLFAQETEIAKSDSVAKIEGELYTIHTVAAKQTLFSIAKTYEVKLSRIAFDNPGVLDGLKLGQQLKILKSAQGETAEVEVESEPIELDGEYVLYTVPKKQTLYAISKEYNTTVSAILDANPELADGLKIGMTIRIPVPKMLGESETEKVEMVGLPDIVKRTVQTNLDTVMRAVGLDSIINRKGGRIALMLPLYLTINDTMSSKALTLEEEKIYKRSEIGLAFYEGFLLAMDSLHQAGYDLEVKVFDTENRPWIVQQLIKTGELSSFDLIVGPLYGKVFNEVAKFGYENCIPVVTPTLQNRSAVNANDYTLKLLSSQEAMTYSLGQYLSQSDSTNNIVVYYGNSGEQDLLWQFRKGLEAGGVVPASFPTIDMANATRDSLRRKLSLVDRNNLILLSSDEVKMASLVRGMDKWIEYAYIVAFAPNSWQNFKNIEMDYLEKLRMHLPTPFHIDYDRLEVQYFVKRFRETFKTEPSTFAFRGYDLGMHLGKNLGGIKLNGPEYLESVQEQGLQSNFSWERLPNGGLENSAPYIVDYTDYQLKIATD